MSSPTRVMTLAAWTGWPEASVPDSKTEMNTSSDSPGSPGPPLLGVRSMFGNSSWSRAGS